MTKKIIFGIIGMILMMVLTSNLVSAHCPLCTAGAVAGVGITRAYGVDDSITGLLLGGFVASTGLWISGWLKKKKINFPAQSSILVILSFLLLAIPMYIKGMIIDFKMVMSMPQTHSMLGMGIYGIDNLLFGMITGTLLISGVFSLSDHLKGKKGKRLFMYQGLVFMLVSLVLFSGLFWILTK
jgi:hypothetical protein